MKKKRVQAKPAPVAKIRFTVDREGADYEFKAGETYELPLPSCRRWVRRNVAVYVDEGALEKAAIPHAPQAPEAKVPDIMPVEPTAEEPSEPQVDTTETTN